MGIEDTIQTFDKHIPKKDQKLFKEHFKYFDLESRNKFQNEFFEGIKGGSGMFANKHIYTATSEGVQAIHNSKKKPSGEALETHMLELLVDKNMSVLKKNDEAKDWRNQWANLKDTFDTEKSKQDYLMKMASAVFGWGDEEIGMATQYMKGAAENDMATYNGALGVLADKTKDTLLTRARSELDAKIQTSPRLVLNANHFYANKLMENHGKVPQSLEHLDSLKYADMAKHHLEIAAAKYKNEDSTASQRGYVDAKKEEKK